MNIELKLIDNVAHLIFDRSNANVNIFDYDILAELDQHLESIQKVSSLAAVIIKSAKPTVFIAGADLKTLFSADLDDINRLIIFGQKVFNRLENLPITTIAAIHGACIGGGLELALACDYRIASDAPCSKFGLPETQLGIIPAWGGSTRLPLLIGLRRALPMIVSGKIISSSAALRKGILDSVCPQQQLDKCAFEYIHHQKRKNPNRFIEHNQIVVSIIRKLAHKNIARKTRNLYPAPRAAVDVVCNSVLSDRKESFHSEENSIKQLLKGPESTELIRLFFLTESAKKLTICKTPDKKIRNAAVIGAGIMGAGITHWLSHKNCRVLLKDVHPNALARGMNTIETLYKKSVQQKYISQFEAAAGIDRITPVAKQSSLHNQQIVIEAVTEDLDLKKKIFSEISKNSAPTTLLATNTSALPINQLADHISHPERLVGIHFFNPVARMKLVEVVKAPQTSNATLAKAVSFIQSIGKLPIVVNDSPGFVVNRILVPYLIEACKLFSEGHCPKQIDRAMLDFGMPMGPLRLLDQIGLDVALRVADTLANAFPERIKVPKFLAAIVSNGILGKKSAAGFYIYNKNQAKPNPYIQPDKSSRSSKKDIQKVLAKLMSAEAAKCLDEKVASSASDIDFAMVMGTGYAPFRGGPLRYAHNTNILQRNFY